MRAAKGLVIGVAAVITACGGNEVPRPQAIQQRLALEGFQSCEALETYIEDTAVLDMRTQLEQAKKGNAYWWGMRGGGPEMMAADGAASAPPQSGPSAYTTTNTQVAGVDEADFVKNDGTRIFVLSGDRLYINKSWPANELATVSSMQIEGWPREMFLDDKNHLVVFSSIWSPTEWDHQYGDVWCMSMRCGYYSSNTVKVTVIDVADIANPRVQQEYFLPGAYSNSRRVGSSVRLVLSDDFRWPSRVRMQPEYEEGLYQDTSRLSAAYDALIKENEKLIRAATLDQWLPPAKRILEDGSEVTVAYDCTDFYKSNAPTRLGLVTVATLNLDSPGVLNRTSVVAEAGEVFASTKNLYIASWHWWWWPEPGQQSYTYLHKFDITDPDDAVYVASGGVDGTIFDQFSMDEDAAGFLRVATTISRTREGGDSWWGGRTETTNRVSVLAEQSGALTTVGKSAELAAGERVTTARFFGEKGYMVTFEQIDPLFTFDMSDPANPRKVGELKIPGFSSYIHPLGPNHLLTIGTYVDPNQQWNTRRVQLQIFDVTDLANPVQAHTQLIGSAYGWSEAQNEHKAFNYFPERKLLAIPFWDYRPTSGYYWYDFISDLRVFEVDAVTGFTPKGAISMKDVYMDYGDNGWDYYWSPAVRRSVMADQFVYAISDAGIRVADVASLGAPLATVRFQKANAQ